MSADPHDAALRGLLEAIMDYAHLLTAGQLGDITGRLLGYAGVAKPKPALRLVKSPTKRRKKP